jgi:hypothetical protein
MTASELFVRKALRTRHRLTPLAAPPVGIVVLLVLASIAKAGTPASDSHRLRRLVKSPVSAQESLSLIELADPRLKVELAASEPQVLDPVAIAFDEKGRMWVVEMGDYPNGPKPGQPPLSRIRLLEDRDGDGFYETAHDFRDHLLFATGIQPWRGGVIVTLSGRVVWMKDTDGDGKADVEETWFTGFSEQNPQLRANHPTFAPDNRVYIANGLRGGDVIARNPKWSAAARPVSISGRDFSFDPLQGTYAAVSGIGQFGTTFDDFGNRFVCSNRNPCQHASPASRRPTSFIATRSNPTGRHFARGRPTPESTFWPAEMNGFGRSILPTAPTVHFTSSTCIGPSSSIRNGFPTS